MIDPQSLVRLVLACAVVGAVLVGLQHALRFASRGRASLHSGGKLLAVLETAALPNAATLHAVRIGERYYAIVRSGTQVATICEIADAAITRAR